MAKDTSIEWTDSTINGSSGCDGCELWTPTTRSCYAGTLHEGRLAHSHPAKYAQSFGEVRMIPGRFRQAADWPDLTGQPRPAKPWLFGRPRHIFIGDMGDFLSDGVTEDFLEKELLAAVTSKNGRRHIWQWLTKRPARLAALSAKWGGLPDNVVAMTTVTSQRTADVRIPQLLAVRCKTRGLSIEPMLGPVDTTLRCLAGWAPEWSLNSLTGRREDPSLDAGPRIDWVIVGGESGTEARPMHPAWARSLRDQCAAAGVPFFFKQWGEWAPWSRDLGDITGKECDHVMENGTKYYPGNFSSPLMTVVRVGKKSAGRLLDGIEHNAFPTVA